MGDPRRQDLLLFVEAVGVVNRAIERAGSPRDLALTEALGEGEEAVVRVEDRRGDARDHYALCNQGGRIAIVGRVPAARAAEGNADWVIRRDALLEIARNPAEYAADPRALDRVLLRA